MNDRLLTLLEKSNLNKVKPTTLKLKRITIQNLKTNMVKKKLNWDIETLYASRFITRLDEIKNNYSNKYFIWKYNLWINAAKSKLRINKYNFWLELYLCKMYKPHFQGQLTEAVKSRGERFLSIYQNKMHSVALSITRICWP